MYGNSMDDTIKNTCMEREPKYLADDLATYAKGDNPAISSIAVSLLRIANTLDKLLEFAEVSSRK